MASKQPDKPRGQPPAKPAAKPSVADDERTVELTRQEIDTFGTDGSKPVRAGGKNAKPPAGQK